MQTRAEQDRLMEEQRLGKDYADDVGFLESTDEDNYTEDSENEDPGAHVCICEHYAEDHVEYVGVCCYCDCQNFRPSTL
jgi:hypothetical protein